MFMLRRRVVVAVMLGTIVLGAGVAMGGENEEAKLREELEALRTKVEQLEAAQERQREQELTTQYVDRTVEEVIRDAQRRSQFLAQSGGFTAGWTKGKFIIQSEDGNYLINPNLQFQFRHVTNYRDQDDGDDIQSGFEVRRMKLGFAGHMFTPDLTYEIVWATERSGGSLGLETAMLHYKLNEHWGIKAGQFKDPAIREDVVSSKRQLAVDRSFVNEAIGGGQTDFVQAAGVTYSNDAFRAQGLFTDGAASRNTDFRDPPTNPFNFGFTVRGDWKVMGDWKAYDDFTARGTEEDLLVIGAGANWSQGGDADTIWHTIDAHWENSEGLGIFAALLGRYMENAANTWDWGFLVQAGYMLDENWEVFGRYDYLRLDDDALAAGAQDEVHEITAGANYYWHGHNAKFTIDVVYFPEGVTQGSSGIGVLAGEDEDQFVFRAQFQLLI